MKNSQRKRIAETLGKVATMPTIPGEKTARFSININVPVDSQLYKDLVALLNDAHRNK